MTRAESPPGSLRARPTAAGVLLLLSLTASGCRAGDTRSEHAESPSTPSRLMPTRDRLAGASPALRERLAASPIALFRFVNEAWTREVCEAFAGDLEALPTARLHGDAHVEQYAVTATARGLDDFDDSARGPAVVDIVRFLGSLELTARSRGWSASLPLIVDAFFDGYERALGDPRYLPADPAVVTRLRAERIKSPDGFLSWADSLMHPLPAADEALMDAAWAHIEAEAVAADPEFTPAFLTRKKAGALRMGIGSALTRKVLVRVEGPTPAFDDDVVLEAKEVTPLQGESCLSVPPSTAEVFRVVEGLHQIGRLEHRLVLALPMLDDRRSDQAGWWVKTWERSYQELEIADLESADDLRELAHDVGAQLGGTNLLESAGSPTELDRRVALEGITARAPRIRQVAHDLTGALLDGWHQFSTK